MPDHWLPCSTSLGGLEKLVGGKTVAIKLNLTGVSYDRLDHFRQEDTYWVHPDVVGATIRLLPRRGAAGSLAGKPHESAEPLEEFMLAAGWEPRDFQNLGTRWSLRTPITWDTARSTGASWFRAGPDVKGYDLNHSYADCDVLCPWRS